MNLKSTAAILGLAALALGPIPSALFPAGTLDVAHADSGKGNGGGNSGKSDSGKSKASDGKSASQGGNGKAQLQSKAKGELASELKGLNAVKANPKALENAAPNSQVGKIATYRDAALATSAAAAAVVAAEAALALLTAPERSVEDIDAAIAELDPTVEGYAEALTALEAERDAAQDYADADAAVQAAEEGVTTTQETEDAALLAASGGRDLSDEAIAYIRSVLGL